MNAFQRNERTRRSRRESSRVPSASEATTLRFYRVAGGESLPQIAKRLYGDESFWGLLFGANRVELDERGRLEPGQTLFVPFL